MSPSAAPPIVVSYRGLNRIISGTEKAQTATQQAAVEVTASPVEQAMLLAQFGEALRKLETASEAADPEVMIAAQDRVASLLQSYAAERGDAFRGEVFEPKPHGGIELTFFTDDYFGWIKSFFSWVRRRDWHPIVRPAGGEPARLADRARVALISDWGTGLYGAPDCARSIDDDPDGFELLLHLGDIYYSGTEKEVQERFLTRWCQRQGVLSRSLNGNHEMYSGGYGYFDKLLPALGQESSYFALQNEHWTLVALDSAHTDHDLDAEQVSWLKRIVSAAGDRKLVLFSHHQLFSRLEAQGEMLAEKLGELLAQERFIAWYWGHEHRCVIYDRHRDYGVYARCLGHGGMPYARDRAREMTEHSHVDDSIWRRFETRDAIPGGLLLDGPNVYMADKADKYGPNGYMTLEIDGAHLCEVVYSPQGRQLFRQDLA